MKPASKWIWVLLVGAPLVALLLSYHKLIFDSPGIDLVDMPEMKVVYVDYTGSYRKTTDSFLPFLDIAKANDLQCQKTWSQYLDTPYFVDAGKLRARVGCTVDAIPEKLPDSVHGVVIPARTYLRARRTDTSLFLVYRLYLLMDVYALRHQLFPARYLIDISDPPNKGPPNAILLIPVSRDPG